MFWMVLIFLSVITILLLVIIGALLSCENELNTIKYSLQVIQDKVYFIQESALDIRNFKQSERNER